MITITGRIPSKKNSKMAIPIGRRCVLITQKAYTVWHKVASLQLNRWRLTIPSPSQLTIDFYFPDHRRTDLSNKAESIMDLLVDNGIIKDDNCVEIPTLILNYRGVDKENPRAEISWQDHQKNTM